MSLFLDVKYVNLVSSRFESFAKKKDFLFACRCPICGDSKKNKSKMRGFIFRKDNSLFYKCHNCGIGLTIGNLIRTLDESLYKNYILERYSQGENGNSNYQKPEFKFKAVRFDKLEKCTYENAHALYELPKEHYAVQYANNRKISSKYFAEIFFTDKFKTFVHELNPDSEYNIFDDARLVFPFYNESNQIEAVVGRALEADNKKRYLKINFDEEQFILYGKNRIKWNEKIKIVEGPIDSLFLNNCVAVGSSALISAAEHLKDHETILIFDNEPRNLEIAKLVEKAINKNYSVVIWPENVQGKDINEMILNGHSENNIENIIENNTFHGLEAKLKYTMWRKC